MHMFSIVTMLCFYWWAQKYAIEIWLADSMCILILGVSGAYVSLAPSAVAWVVAFCPRLHKLRYNS